MSDASGMTNQGSSWSDYFGFLRAWARAPRRTGAIAPSSPGLTREMAFAAAPTVGQKVLELGPGTGTVTDALLEYGVSERDLVLVELSPNFAADLRKRYPMATILQQDAFDAISSLKSEQIEFTAVVSSLPLLVFPPDKRLDLVEAGLELVVPMGRFVQFTYHLASPLRGKPDFRVMRSRRIWRNLPPATVWTFQNGASSAIA